MKSASSGVGVVLVFVVDDVELSFDEVVDVVGVDVVGFVPSLKWLNALAEFKSFLTKRELKLNPKQTLFDSSSYLTFIFRTLACKFFSRP